MIYEDGVFAKMLKESGQIEERDYKTYVTLFDNMSNFIKRPNLIIHLDILPEQSLKRIQRRGRECERNITIEYLTRLYNEYETFVQEISRVIPVIRVNWSEFQTADEIAKRIDREYQSLHVVRHIDFFV